MFGIRTPTKKLNVTIDLDKKPPEAGPSNKPSEVPSNVRRSIGEGDVGKAVAAPRSRSPVQIRKEVTPSEKAVAKEKIKPTQKLALSQEAKVGTKKPLEIVDGSPKERVKYTDRLAEAKACVTKAKLNLANSRNIKTEIKESVIQAVDRLYQLVKEGESVKGQGRKEVSKEPEKEKEKADEGRGVQESVLIKKMEEHAQLIENNRVEMERLRETIGKHQEAQEKATYASVAAAPAKKHSPEQTALHSVIVTGKDETETGEEVLNRIRKAVNAKEGGIVVERIRKAKDRKVIMGCRTEEEREKLKERLTRANDHLQVEEVRNKDPRIILKDVLKYNNDEEVLSALKNQNKGILGDLEIDKQTMEILYKKRTRNPHTHHIVLRVSPKVWQKAMDPV